MTHDRKYLCLHHQVELAAAEFGGKIALISGTNALTYSELNFRANQISTWLGHLGVGRGRRVAICLDRSTELVVAMLGVLKSGAAYVNVDLKYPADYLEFMFRDAAPSALITSSCLAGKVPDLDLPVIRLDDSWSELARWPGENLDLPVGAEDLAHLIYTSGSTGRPKAAMIPHCSVLGFALNVPFLQFAPEEVFLHYSSVSWDAVTLEVWLPLSQGAASVILPDEVPSLHGIAEAIEVFGVTVLWLTASVYNLMIENYAAALSRLKALMVGSEQVSAPHIRRAQSLLPSVRIINGYGPSECGAFSVCNPECQQLSAGMRSVPIGKPVGDRKIYLLDPDFRRLSIGKPGEIFISGKGVGWGYLNLPDRTAAVFLPDPLSPLAGSRMYRSGDLARYLKDGMLEFVGRTDDQVKIRGHRVELTAIESVLGDHPQVRQCAVCPRRTEQGDYLVAFIVLRSGNLARAELTAYLRNLLPTYLIPSVYVFVDQFPLTPNGKLDRKRLSEMEIGDLEREPRSRPAYDREEFALAQIWQRVLGVEQIGVDDNFFKLGGHSLLALELCARIDRELGVRISTRDFFVNPTIRQLLAVIRQSGETVLAQNSLVPLQPNGTRATIFFVHPGGGFATAYVELSNLLSPQYAFYGFQSRGLGLFEEPLHTVEEMARAYIGDLKQVQPQGPYCVGGWSFGTTVAFEIAQQLKRAGEHVAMLALVDGGLMSAAGAAQLANWPKEFLRHLAEDFDLDPKRVGAFDPRDPVTSFVDIYRGSKKWSPEGERWVRVYGLNTQAGYRYAAREYDGPACLFLSKMDPDATPESDCRLSWLGLLQGKARIFNYETDHEGLFKGTSVGRLAADLRACLEQA